MTRREPAAGTTDGSIDGSIERPYWTAEGTGVPDPAALGARAQGA